MEAKPSDIADAVYELLRMLPSGVERQMEKHLLAIQKALPEMDDVGSLEEEKEFIITMTARASYHSASSFAPVVRHLLSLGPAQRRVLVDGALAQVRVMREKQLAFEAGQERLCRALASLDPRVKAAFAVLLQIWWGCCDVDPAEPTKDMLEAFSGNALRGDPAWTELLKFADMADEMM